MEGRHLSPLHVLHFPRRAWGRWFAGSTVPPEPWSWPIFLLVMVLASCLFLTRLHLPLLEPEETRYAEIPRQMLAEGRVLEPVWHGEPYYHKPPLLYWLVMLSYQMLGVSDGAARLVPALATLALIAVVYGWAYRVSGRRAALIAALLLCLSARFVFLGRMLVMDGLLALWVTAALACGHLATREGKLRWGWWLTAALAGGLGVLTKGPVALVLIAAPMLLYGWLEVRAAQLSGKAGLAFLAVVALVAGPWFVAVACHSPEAMRAFFLQHHVERFLQPFDHREPLWFFVPALLVGLFPGSLLLVPLVRVLSARRPDLAGLRSEAFGFFLLAFLCGFGFFSLSGCKRPVYLLPCLPLFALLLTTGFAAIAPVTRRARIRWGIAAMLIFGIILVGVQEGLPRYHRHFGLRGEVRRHRDLEAIPVVCYPHRWDSVSFYLDHDHVRAFGPKDGPALRAFLEANEETLLFVKNKTHLEEFQRHLSPTLEFVPRGRAGWNVTAGIVRRRAAVANLASSPALAAAPSLD